MVSSMQQRQQQQQQFTSYKVQTNQYSTTGERITATNGNSSLEQGKKKYFGFIGFKCPFLWISY